MWNVLKSLNGHQQGDNDKVFSSTNGLRVSNRSKANAFGAHYKKVCQLKVKKENSNTKNKTQQNERSEADFTRKELNAGITKLSPNKAASPMMSTPVSSSI